MTVSVVIATWNRSRSLERAVRSALAQTHAPLEVLVCDDASTDDTAAVVRSIGDERVVWLPGERAGRPAVPRNRGIRASRGAWLAFLDDDDAWLPEKLELQLAEAGRHGCRAVCCDAWRVTPGASAPAQLLLGGESGRLRFADLLRVNGVICSSMMVRRETLEAAGGFPEAPALRAIEDYALWLKVAHLTEIAYLARPLLEYTDAPACSIRNEVMTVAQQKRLAMREFLSFDRRRIFSGDHLRAALTLVSQWRRKG